MYRFLRRLFPIELESALIICQLFCLSFTFSPIYLLPAFMGLYIIFIQKVNIFGKFPKGKFFFLFLPCPCVHMLGSPFVRCLVNTWAGPVGQGSQHWWCETGFHSSLAKDEIFLSWKCRRRPGIEQPWKQSWEGRLGVHRRVPPPVPAADALAREFFRPGWGSAWNGLVWGRVDICEHSGAWQNLAKSRQHLEW